MTIPKKAPESPHSGDRGPNKVKLLALGVCLLLFLACLGVSGNAIYARMKPPPPPPTREFRFDYGSLIADRDAKAKVAANEGKEAKEKNDYAAALTLYKKAVGLWKANVELIENLRAGEVFGGREYEWIERAAANDNMFIHDANQEIYELDSILARPEAERKPDVNKGEETPF
jgi:hypothetical protein